MKLTVQPVPPAVIHQTWPLVEGFLEEALKWGEDDYTKDQAKALLADGTWVLLVAVDEENKIHGAASVNFFNMPNDRIAFITAIGGRLISNTDTYAQLCNVVKGFGATKIQGAARESIARLWNRYGFKERYIIVEAKI
jgi:hypothetical protein